MLTPIRLVIAGIVIIAAGFALGSADVDPVSAWVGTAGMLLTLAGLIWIAVEQARAHDRGHETRRRGQRVE